MKCFPMVALLAAFGALVAPARADNFPARTISVIVPYAAGGAMDTVGRIVADQLQQKFGVSVIVDNRPGAGGLLGLTYVSKAQADGYTLMISSEVSQALSPALDPKFPLDSLNVFTPIALVGSFPQLLVTRSSLGAESVSQFIALAKSQPGKLNYGSNGVGLTQHVAMELLKKKSGIDLVHIPYRGAMGALTDLLAGRVDANMQSLPNMASQLGNPSLKILATLGAERDDRIPDVPTMIESGFPDFDFTSWTAVFGPQNMPADVVSKISLAVVEAVKLPAVRDRLRSVGFKAEGWDSVKLDSYQRTVAARWKRIAEETGIRIEQ
jgi:tripartite-type tricarboxylate transporter receptor subunit TctC